jgi:hypothetical protein
MVIVVTAGLSSALGTAETEAAMFRDDETDDGEPVTIAFVSPPSGSIGPMFLFGDPKAQTTNSQVMNQLINDSGVLLTMLGKQ